MRGAALLAIPNAYNTREVLRGIGLNGWSLGPTTLPSRLFHATSTRIRPITKSASPDLPSSASSTRSALRPCAPWTCSSAERSRLISILFVKSDRCIPLRECNLPSETIRALYHKASSDLLFLLPVPPSRSQPSLFFSRPVPTFLHFINHSSLARYKSFLPGTTLVYIHV